MKYHWFSIVLLSIVFAGFGCSNSPFESSKKEKGPKIINTVFTDISETGEPAKLAPEETTQKKDLSHVKNNHVVLEPDPKIFAELKNQKLNEIVLIERNSLKNWTLDTNHTGKGSLENSAIKFSYNIDKKRAMTSTLRYKSPTPIDFADKKLLKFEYKWSNPKNQLYIALSNKSGKSITRHLVGKDVEANVWHTAVVPLVGIELSDIDKIDFENSGDKYEGWTDGQSFDLWIDNIRYIESPAKNLFGKNVVIQFDDGYLDNYTEALPLFQKYDAVATLGMVSASIGGQLVGKDMLSVDQLREMEMSGWEISSHTATHKSMEDATGESSIDYQMKESAKTLRDLGFQVNHLIYPFTKSGKISYGISPKYFESASIGGPPNQNFVNGLETIYGKTDKHLLNRMPIGISTSLDSVKSWVQDSIRYQTFLILYFHDINDLGGKDSWSAKNLEALLSWLKEEGIHTLTTTEALHYYGF